MTQRLDIAAPGEFWPEHDHCCFCPLPKMLCPQISMGIPVYHSVLISVVTYSAFFLSTISQRAPSPIPVTCFSYFMVHIHSLKLAIYLFIVTYLFSLNPKLHSSPLYLCHPRQCPTHSRGSVHACWIHDLSWSQSTSPFFSSHCPSFKTLAYGGLLHCWWDCKLVQPPWKTVRRFLKKLKIELPYDSAILFLSIYPDEITSQKDICTPICIALFKIAKTWKQPKWQMNGWWCVVCVYAGKPTWASLVAQTVKNLPAVQEIQVQSLGWEDVLEKGMVTHSSILVCRTPWTEEPGELHTVHGVTMSWTQLNTQAYTHTYIHNETLLGHKKEWNYVIAETWMDPEITILSEERKKDKYPMISLICGI